MEYGIVTKFPIQINDCHHIYVISKQGYRKELIELTNINFKFILVSFFEVCKLTK